jgi:hypothetical protein
MSEHHRTAEWAATVRVMRPRIQASLPQACIDCGRPITRDMKWQVGHRVSVAEAKRQGWSVQQINAPSNLGPSHAKAPGQKACNQIAGAKLGRALQLKAKADDQRMPQW